MTSDINKYSRFNFDEPIDLNGTNALNIETIKLNTKDKHLVYQLENNTYTFNLSINKFDATNEDIVVILSKDNAQILEYTLQQLDKLHILDRYDVLLVDDRSETNGIELLAKRYNLSYLRIDNANNIFNYSVLNNIAILYAKLYNKQICIFYNNDMWPHNEAALDNLVNKHKQFNSGITGCRLLYPSEQEYNDLGKPQHILSQILSNIYSTIQHGGIYFGLKQTPFIDPRRNYIADNIVLAPMHSWRFYSKDHYFANLDSPCFAVTGALQIVNIQKFIDVGGFTPSLPTSFQDIDLCFKMIDHQIPVYYIGSEYMVHAESLTHFQQQLTKTQHFVSDNLFWDYVWGYRVPNMIGCKV